MKNNKAPLLIGILITAVLCISSPYLLSADDFTDSMFSDEIHMRTGDLATVKTSALTRVSLTDPSIVDIVDANIDEVLLIGQEPGRSTLFVWDDNGKRSISIVVTRDDLEQVKERLEKLFKEAGIKLVDVSINEVEGKVILAGEVFENQQDQYDEVLEQVDDGIIIDLTNEEVVRDLIELNMQITEVNVSSLKTLGFDWGSGGSSELVWRYDETLPEFDNTFTDFFKIGDFQRIHALNVQLNALETKGEAKVLSRPKIIVMSGEEASFLIGGEVPIRTTTAFEGTSQENIEYKEYGISLSLTPEVIDEKIEIDLSIEDSDIDASIQTTDVAFLTRTAQTKLYLEDNQPIILAGFIRKIRSETVEKVPFLADVPLIGALFRMKTNPSANVDTELIISLTPTIIAKNRKGDVRKKDMAVKRKPEELRRITKRVNPNYISGIPREMTSYVQNVQEKISNMALYPPEAQSNGWEGTVKLGMLILNDGTLAYALVKDSSGHELFDEYALNRARESAPFEPFPVDTDLQELNITIPIVYSITK